jgi:hypothetical protein
MPEPESESPLNNIIAVLVALTATFMALCNIKDGNITQAMQQAQAGSLDQWSYYQSKSTKQNLAEAMLDQFTIERDMATGPERDVLEKKVAVYAANVKRYETREGRDQVEGRGISEAVRRSEHPRRSIRHVGCRALRRAGDARRHGADEEEVAARGLRDLPALRLFLRMRGVLRMEHPPRFHR